MNTEYGQFVKRVMRLCLLLTGIGTLVTLVQFDSAITLGWLWGCGTGFCYLALLAYRIYRIQFLAPKIAKRQMKVSLIYRLVIFVLAIYLALWQLQLNIVAVGLGFLIVRISIQLLSFRQRF